MPRLIASIMAALAAICAASAQEIPPPVSPPAGEETAQSATAPEDQDVLEPRVSRTGEAEAAAESEASIQESEETSTPFQDGQLPADAGSTTPGDPAAAAAGERARETAAEQAQREREREQRRADPFDDIYVYLPEGEFDIRTSRLIRNTLFEGRVNYGFVDGDISTYLRYKYYARRATWRLGVFDSVGFDSVESGSRDFDRVRGGSLMFEMPRDYLQRYVGLVQVDGYSFGDVDRPDNNRTNVFVKLGYQYGTAFDPTLNSITGDSRGRIVPVLSAYRELGPRDFSYAAALSWAVEGVGGDYDYLRFEAEAVKRVFVSERSFVIARAHLGAFPLKSARDFALDADPGESDDPTRELSFLYAPRDELFRIGGREALRGVDDSIRGTEQFHLTAEYFVPVFLNEDYDTMRLRWRNFYAIGYVGGGSFGYEISELADSDRWILDAGIGFEAELRYRDITGYLSFLYAQPVMKPDWVDGGEFLVALRTRR